MLVVHIFAAVQFPFPQVHLAHLGSCISRWVLFILLLIIWLQKKIIPLKTKNHPTEEEKNHQDAKPNINLFKQHSVELIVELESLAKKSKHYKKCKRVEKAEKIKFGGK